MCARRRRQITARGFFDLFMNIFNIGVLFFSCSFLVKMNKNGVPFSPQKDLSLSLWHLEAKLFCRTKIEMKRTPRRKHKSEQKQELKIQTLFSVSLLRSVQSKLILIFVFVIVPDRRRGFVSFTATVVTAIIIPLVLVVVFVHAHRKRGQILNVGFIRVGHYFVIFLR